MKSKKIGYQHQKYWHPKSYVAFMHVPAINDLIPKYVERARNTNEPDWYAKDVALYFTYEDEAYALYPSNIHASPEVFELLENDFADDLYDVGAYDIYCSGMMD